MENINEEEIKENTINKNNDLAKVQDKEINPIKKKDIFIDYFEKKKKYYSKQGYETPLLDELIKGNIKIDNELFKLKKPKDDKFFEPHYPNLENVILIFNDSRKFEQCVIKEENYGYICLKIEDKNNYLYREGIYAILSNDILFDEITNKNKFAKEDIYIEDQEIVDNSYKARGLSLEYYLNEFLVDYLSEEEKPRVIYNFDINVLKKSTKKEGQIHVENKEEKKQFKKDKKAIQKTESKKGEEDNRIIEIEELDGIFYVENEIQIDTQKLPFIMDDILDNQGQQFEFELRTNNFLKFNAKTLILFEVKNRFPENMEKEMYILLNKAMDFYQLYKERYDNIEKIRIIFFYDAVPKDNYDSELLRILNNFFKDKDIKKKIQFQIIFIASSYIAFNFKYLKERIDNIERANNIKIDRLTKTINTLSLSLKEVKDEIKNIKEKNEKLIQENASLKTVKKDLEEKLERINNSSKNKINGKNKANKK